MIRLTYFRIFAMISLWALVGSFLAGSYLARPSPSTSPPNLVSALAAQQERVALDPRDPVAWNDLGNLLLVVGRDTEAEEAYRQALALAPADPAARFNLALLMQQSGRVKDAESELLHLLELTPRHAWAHYQLGVILAARKERARALDHYARALAYDPSLTFAENNPHIIDNPLFTEALLLSQRFFDPVATRVPRLYGEPERIVQLMLQSAAGQGVPLPTEDVGAASVPEGGTASGSPPVFEDAPPAAVDAEAGSRREGLAPPQPGTTVIPVPGARPAADPQSADPPQAVPERRTVTPREVPPSSTVRRDEPVDASGRTPPRADRPTLRRSPPPPSPPRSSRYIPPSRRSSAQMELELLPPEETPERYASATGPTS